MQNVNDGMCYSDKDTSQRVVTNNEAATDMPLGTVVILDTSDTSGNGVLMPAAEGQSVVIGVTLDYIPFGETGRIAPIGNGNTAIVRVNGTDNIAAGNALRVYDTNGVAYLGSTLSVCFGVALDAYTPNDSLGLIPVYLRRW